MFKDRLEEFLQREFDAHVNDLLASSQKPECVSFSLIMVSFAYPAANSSGVLHAQSVKGVENLRGTVFGAVDIVTARTGLRINKLAPLDRLSDDILMLILLHLDNRNTFFAAKVSRRWRTVALHSPSVWTNIDLSCHPVEFERRFKLFTTRSKNAPLNIKLAVESTDVDTSDDEEDKDPSLIRFRWEQCGDEVNQQLEHHVQRIAMAPEVLARVRTLDITSTLTLEPYNYHHGHLRQPTPTLQLAASPSLQRLRLNWADPDVHELHLVLDSKPDAFDSVFSLALCAVDNLWEVLPRFPRVANLSLWLEPLDDYAANEIHIANICSWMPRLRKLEIVEVPDDFAAKPLVTKPSLHRLILHGRWANDVLADLAKTMDLDKIPEISLRNNTRYAYKTGFIPAASRPTDQLTVYNCPKWIQSHSGYHLYAEDGFQRLRYLQSKYKRLHCEEMVSYTTINANVEALFEILPEKIPQLVILRIHLDSFRRSTSDRRPEMNLRPLRSCPALAHLELYVGYDRTSDGEIVSGVQILNWISLHLQDFSQPLDTLRVVGVRVEADLDALNNFARTVLFTSAPLFK